MLTYWLNDLTLSSLDYSSPEDLKQRVKFQVSLGVNKVVKVSLIWYLRKGGSGPQKFGTI